jgi:hypothetical protein
VLVVDGAHAHAAGMVPGKKSHMSLQRWLKSLSDRHSDS